MGFFGLGLLINSKACLKSRQLYMFFKVYADGQLSIHGHLIRFQRRKLHHLVRVDLRHIFISIGVRPSRRVE